MATTLETTRDDLLSADVDAIVNPANSQLNHGGGLARVIAQAAGPELEEDSRRIGFVACGDAAVTRAGNLPQRAVIHAVGPVWHGGTHGEEADLASAHRAIIRLCTEQGFRSVAIPAISTGLFGYPAELAAPVAVAAVRAALAEYDHQLTTVRFCFSDDDKLALWRQAIAG